MGKSFKLIPRGVLSLIYSIVEDKMTLVECRILQARGPHSHYVFLEDWP
jgi:hypothetical protein